MKDASPSLHSTAMQSSICTALGQARELHATSHINSAAELPTTCHINRTAKLHTNNIAAAAMSNTEWISVDRCECMQ